MGLRIQGLGPRIYWNKGLVISMTFSFYKSYDEGNL